MSMSRRRALRNLAMAPAGLSGLAHVRNRREAGVPGKSVDVKEPALTMAGYAYDRVLALTDGRVKVAGRETNFAKDRIGNLNTHVFSGSGTRDVSEIGLHPFILAYANDEFRDYTLLPIFPLRVFRHKSIFIRSDRGITGPQDLIGKRIATPGFSSTSLTWIRGTLEDEYGVKPSDVEWYVSAKDSSAKESGGPSRFENILPGDLTIKKGPAGKDESEMLADGDVDALFHAMEPRCYTEGHPDVSRLFQDFRTTERSYYEKTGVFPIMHAVAIKRELVESDSSIAPAVCEAYSQAKAVAMRELDLLGWANISLPWVAKEIEETRSLMGKNFWPYGIKPNRDALETLCRYSHQQGMASRQLAVEELFHASTLDWVEPG